ncbi:hypothetical protein HDU98_004970, partial [Podochytrium sp. JEL0797]
MSESPTEDAPEHSFAPLLSCAEIVKLEHDVSHHHSLMASVYSTMEPEHIESLSAYASASMPGYTSRTPSPPARLLSAEPILLDPRSVPEELDPSSPEPESDNDDLYDPRKKPAARKRKTPPPSFAFNQTRIKQENNPLRPKKPRSSWSNYEPRVEGRRTTSTTKPFHILQADPSFMTFKRTTKPDIDVLNIETGKRERL